MRFISNRIRFLTDINQTEEQTERSEMRGEREKREMHLYTTEQNDIFVQLWVIVFCRGMCNKLSNLTPRLFAHQKVPEI